MGHICISCIFDEITSIINTKSRIFGKPMHCFWTGLLVPVCSSESDRLSRIPILSSKKSWNFLRCRLDRLWGIQPPTILSGSEDENKCIIHWTLGVLIGNTFIHHSQYTSNITRTQSDLKRCSLPSPLQKRSKDYKGLHRSSASFSESWKLLAKVEDISEAQNLQDFYAILCNPWISSAMVMTMSIYRTLCVFLFLFLFFSLKFHS